MEKVEQSSSLPPLPEVHHKDDNQYSKEDLETHVEAFNPSPSYHERRGTFKTVCLIMTCTAAMILNTANATAISIALPTIGRDLNIVEYKLQWLVSAYSLSSGCLLLFLGRLADLYGRKRTFLLGIAFQGAFGLGCAFAQDEVTIDILRGFQGIGGAAIIPAALGTLAHAFPPSRLRSFAFASFGAGAPVGASVGNLIGGVLTELTPQSWRATLYMMTGLSAIAFLGGAFSIDPDILDMNQDRRIDWLGALLVTAGLVLILFVLSDGSVAPNGWRTGYIIALLVIGVLLIVAFLLWQHYLESVHYKALQSPDDAALAKSKWTPPPLMKLSVWKLAKGRLAVIFWIGFLEWFSFNSFSFWLQLYYQDFEGLSSIQTMLRFLPMSVSGVICNLIVALVVGYVDFMILIALGMSLTAVANLLFAVIDVNASYWAYGFPAAVICVFGADFVMAAGSLFVAKFSPLDDQSVSGAVLQTMMQLGGAFGLAITTIIFNETLSNQSAKFGVSINQSGTNASSAPHQAQESAYRAAMWGGFAFGVLGAVLAAVFLNGVGIVGHVERKKSAMGDSQEPESVGEEGRSRGDSATSVEKA
ncbi:MFS general substrate transporter [Panus rudis PR-1116 ss-1]|nr:MFS general substrate transporter [Panus rudis PR-1116 ss-1]